jgi:glycosyltransferase involved in cell wall biosynthesis
MAPPQTPTIGLAMIVRDVSAFIVSCLDSIIDHCHEVVITDTGSRDDTKDVLHRYLTTKGKPFKLLDYTPQTHPQSFLLDEAAIENRFGGAIKGPFTGEQILADFGAARQFGWEQMTSDFLLWIDSDDLVDGADKIWEVAEDLNKNNLCAAMITYEYAHDQDGRSTCTQTRERLIRRDGSNWNQPIHELVNLRGPARYYPNFKIVHRRGKVGVPSKISHRNLKVLHLEHERQRATGKVDPRLLFYIGMETRFTDMALAEKFLREYISASGWDEERALAHMWLGEHAESNGDLENSFLRYSACATEFPWIPDGLFACARISYFRALKKVDGKLDAHPEWNKCIEYTERGIKIRDTKQERHSSLHYNPADREYRPYQYVSKAYIDTGRVNDGLDAARKALAFNPHDESMKVNIRVAEEWLAGQNKPQPMGLALPLNEKIEDPPAKDIPTFALSMFAIQLWKQIRLEDLSNGANGAPLRFLEALPKNVKSDGNIQKAFEMSTPHQVPKKLDIVIWTGAAYENWCPRNLEAGIGGSETAAIHMAQHFTNLGHKVRVFGNCRGLEGNYDGVEYVNFQAADMRPTVLNCDVFICSRQPFIFEKNFSAKLRILWMHDTDIGQTTPALQQQVYKADKVFCLSEWHRDHFHTRYPWVHRDTIFVTRNGIDPSRFAKEPEKKGNRLVFSSSANRGLDLLLDLFPEVRAEVPDAELHLFYGFDTWEKMAQWNQWQGQKTAIDALKKRIETTPGVVNHGRRGQKELAEAFLAAKIWSYPTAFSETSCISAVEAQAAGCVPVTTKLAALAETVKHGVLVDPPNTSPTYTRTWVSETIRLLHDEKARSQIAEAGRKEALKLSWESLAKQWQDLFFELLEHKRAKPLTPYGQEDRLPAP